MLSSSGILDTIFLYLRRIEVEDIKMGPKRRIYMYLGGPHNILIGIKNWSTRRARGGLTSAKTCSDRENYFGRAGQNRQPFSGLPNILSPCQTFLPVDFGQISINILIFLVAHFMFSEPCWTKCPARSQLSAGHQQKSTGHVWHVRHISRSLKHVPRELVHRF